LRLVITGGGTGGHVYPALEVARLAKEREASVLYLGSLRGQEGRLCEKAGIEFAGLPSLPLKSLRTLSGWRGLAGLLRSRMKARNELGRRRPDAVFSTGGYAAAPVVSAAQALGIPTVLHEQNSLPGRSNLLFARKAHAIGVTFRSSESHFEGCRVVRTGMPVRRELRAIASSKRERDLLPLFLVVGGSQGARAVNEAALGAAQRMHGRALHWLHSTGKAHFEAVFSSYEKLALKDCYEVRAYLEGEAMAEAYMRASLLVGRAGAGTLAEAAAFGLCGILIPYPHAYADHQRHNAEEFAAMEAATVLAQSDLSPASLESAIIPWLENPSRRERAAVALADWDAPNAAQDLFELVSLAAGASEWIQAKSGTS